MSRVQALRRLSSRAGSEFLNALAVRLRSGWRSARARQLRAKRRAQIHHVYYVLAAFDVAAVAGGLLLSHLLMNMLTASIGQSLAWRDLEEQVAYLRSTTSRISAPGTDVLRSGDVEHQRERLESARRRYESASMALRTRAGELIPDAMLPLASRAMQLADASTSELAKLARRSIDLFESGDLVEAEAAQLAMERAHGWALDEIDNVARTVRLIEAELGRKWLERAAALGRMELILCAMILIMVLGVTLLGHRIGKALVRSTQRLAAMRAELEQRVAERTRELAAAKAELSRQREELLVQNTHLEATLNNTMRGLCLFDSDGKLVMANQRYYELYGFTPEEVAPGIAIRDIVRLRAARGHFGNQNADEYYQERVSSVAARRISIRNLEMPDGRVVEVSIYPTSDGGWVSMHDDITDERLTQQRIVHLAHHDVLTGLTNRLRFHEELAGMLKRAERGERFAVHCLDLDQFKHVNDTLGHPIGDRLLKAVAERLRSCVRKGDIVARMGGDEFAVIETMVERPEAAAALALRIIEAIRQPFVIDEHQVAIGTSVGIALAPSDGTEADALIKNADLALYRAKADGRGTYRLFEAGMDARLQERRRLEMDLRQALPLDQLELNYQPLIDARTLRINGFEALLRWRHPERGLVSPADFIPLAEEIGLMGAIGAWVLKQGCCDAMSWPCDHRVAINVSPCQFRGRPLELDVMAALAASGLPADRLELEITESVLLEDKSATIDMLSRLRALGIRIAMDDFGTGYSSLSYLLSFPFDKIKLDRSFTNGLGRAGSAQPIVQAVIGLGRGLGISTTAEGVETDEQLQRLRAEGCSEVQGFLFSRPVPASEIPRVLDKLSRPLAEAV